MTLYDQIVLSTMEEINEVVRQRVMGDDCFRKSCHGRPPWEGDTRVESWKRRRSWPRTLLAQECPGRGKNNFTIPELRVFRIRVHGSSVAGAKWARREVRNSLEKSTWASQAADHGRINCFLLHIPLGLIYNFVTNNLYFFNSLICFIHPILYMGYVPQGEDPFTTYLNILCSRL